MKAGLAFLLAASLLLASCSSRVQEDMPDAGRPQPPSSSSSQSEESSKTEQSLPSLDTSASSASSALASSSDAAPSSGSTLTDSAPPPEQAPLASSGGAKEDIRASSAEASASAASADAVSSSTDASSPSAQPAQEGSSSQAVSEDPAAQADESSGNTAPRARTAGSPADEASLASEQEDEESSSEPEKKPAYNLSSKYFLSDVENEFIKILNEEREQAGLSRLQKDETLASAARLRAVEQVKNGYFAHKRPDGRDWNTVLSEEFPCDFRRQGENLASASYEGGPLSHQTARQWFDQWEASPSHYENMFRPEFTYIGVGIYYSYEDGSYSSVAATLFAAD